MTIKTILLIEDDRFIGEMYVRSLRRADYEVDWVVDGNDGLVAARNRTYDLILLDFMLPERHGSEVIKTLRGSGQDLIPNSRIIVLTNFEQDESSRAEMQQFADGYLVKAEITPRKLIAVIEQLNQE